MATSAQTTAKATGPFTELTADDAIALIEGSLPEEVETNRLFIEGDHWQDGDGWIGPTPPVDDSDYDLTLDLIRDGFTSRNVIREIVQRRMRGVVGREPRFGVVPRAPISIGTDLTDAQKKLKLEIELALTEWWDRRKVHETIQKAVSNASWATKGPIRVYIPLGKLKGGEVPKMPDLERALRLIYVEAPDPELATVEEDDDTKEEIGILQTKISEDITRIELCYLGPDVDDDGSPDTVIRIIDKSRDGSTTEEEFTIELGGRIMIAEIKTELLITQQQQQLQRALNLSLTMMPHNIVTGGFLERTILNGLPPGHWQTDPTSRAKTFVREPYVTGPGVTSWVRGLELPQKDGSTAITTPSVTYRDPVDPEFANKAKRAVYQDMLEEADQPHVLISGDATASGRSREQARADFELSLTQLEAPTNGVGRWIIETVLALAEMAMQTPGAILDEWRGQFECRLNTGPISIDERAQNLQEANANLLARDTAMERNGVADVDAEQARIAAQPDRGLALLERQSAIVQNLTQGGADIEGAAEVAGIENPSRLVPQDIPPTPAPDGGPPEPTPAPPAGG